MSRPPPSSTSSAGPPLYLSHPAPPYCHTCGRIIAQAPATLRKRAEQARAQKYCSVRCRGNKPGALDAEIERVFVRELLGAGRRGKGKGKGSTGGEVVVVVGRIVMCDGVEEGVFGERRRMEGRRRRRREEEEEGGEVGEVGKVRAGRESGGGVGMDVEEESAEGEGEVMRPLPELGNLDVLMETAAEIAEASTSDGETAGSTDDPTTTAPANPSGHGQPTDYGPAEVNWSQVLGPVGTDDYVQRPELLASFGESGGHPDAEGMVGEEDPRLKEKRDEGQKKAEEREMVRRAARRGVVFGFVVDAIEGGGETGTKRRREKAHKGKAAEDAGQDANVEIKERRRKCEAVQHGVVVEPSFAKGDWGIRWRE